MRPINTSFTAPRPCFLLENALDEGRCAEVVAAATRRGFAATAVDYPPSYRDNDRIVITDRALADEIFAHVRSGLPDEITDETGARLRLVGLNERFRMCRYTNGQSFRIHQDGAHAVAPGVRSRLTLQIYLDEHFTGGATRFYESRKGPLLGAIVPKTGTAAIFAHDLWHDGEPVTEGTKHVLRTDVIYERVDASPVTERDDVLRGHEGYVFIVRRLSDGSLVSGSRDRTIRRWTNDGARWRETARLEGHSASVLAFAELGHSLVSGSRDRTVRRFDLETGASSVLATLGGAVLALEPLAGGAVACASADGVITILDHDGSRRRDLAGHTGWVWALARSEGRLVSGSDDGTLRLWDPITGECLAGARPGRGAVHALAARHDGTVAAGFADGHVVVYDTSRGTLDPVAVLAAHDGEVYALCALSDGRLATGGEDMRSRIFDVATGTLLETREHDGFVRSIAALPRGGLAIGSYDGTIRLNE